MALVSNVLVRKTAGNRVLIIAVLDNDGMFDAFDDKDDNFVMAETDIVDKHVAIRLNGSVVSGETWEKKTGINFSTYRVDQLLLARIWFCQKVESFLELLNK